MSIDVEDWFQVSALAPYVARDHWDSMPFRAEANVELLLELLAAHDTQATFFTLGWIAERHPGIVRRIVAAGHELASHGYGHQRATELSPDAFRDDVSRSRALLEDISGKAVIGYRAPSFSIGRDNLWALDTLAEAGYRYSSSIYPVAHDHYGMPEASRFAFLTGRGLLEIPATSLRLGGRNFPASGGGYFRLLPYRISRWGIERVNRVDKEAAVFYCHPWEFDPLQPRLPGVDLKTRFRHYVNLDRNRDKLERLLQDFNWSTLAQVFGTRIGGQA
ncbi:MAG: DUF3473 domain-containing protein [Burkholderiaceae bacterium]|nr:DUF3473 domain-containing protein [Burkholderiaceae bacterium]